jgi:hypothetical protein
VQDGGRAERGPGTSVRSPRCRKIRWITDVWSISANDAQPPSAALACACAALIPALRAGRIDPVAALRQD